MYKIYRILLSVLLTLALVIVPCMAQAEMGNTEKAVSEETVKKFFTVFERVWDKNGNEITETFYLQFSDDYESENYTPIGIYIYENVSRAESAMSKSIARSTGEVTRWAHKMLTSTNHDGRFQMDVQYTAVLRYVIDASGVITEARTPLVEVENLADIGGLAPEFSVTGRSASINSSGSMATYRFTIEVDQTMLSSGNPLNGQHIYFEWDVTERLYADDI